MAAGKPLPTIVSAAAEAFNTVVSQQEIAMPSGRRTGDLVVIVFRPVLTATTPAGWTLSGSLESGGLGLYVLSRVMDGSESSVQITLSAAQRSAWAIYCVRHASRVAANVALGLDPPSVQRDWSSAVALTSLSFRQALNLSGATPPAGYGDAVQAINTGTTNSFPGIASAHKASAAPSADPATWTVTGTAVDFFAATVLVGR